MNITVIGKYLGGDINFLIGPYRVVKGTHSVLHVDESTFMTIVNLQRKGDFSIKSHTYLQYLQAMKIMNDKEPDFDLVDIYTDYIKNEPKKIIPQKKEEPENVPEIIEKYQYQSFPESILVKQTTEEEICGQITIDEMMDTLKENNGRQSRKRGTKGAKQ